MATKLAIIGNGTNRMVAVTAPSALVNLFTLDLVTGLVTSGADSAGNPFFTTAEVANLSTVLKQIIAAAAESSATPTATTVANLITQLAALDGNTYPVTTSLLSGTNYQVVVTPSAVPAVFAVQKPYSTYGSMGFGGQAAGGGGGGGSPASISKGVLVANGMSHSAAAAFAIPPTASGVEMTGAAPSAVTLPPVATPLLEASGYLVVNNQSGGAVVTVTSPDAGGSVNGQPSMVVQPGQSVLFELTSLAAKAWNVPLALYAGPSALIPVTSANAAAYGFISGDPVPAGANAKAFAIQGQTGGAATGALAGGQGTSAAFILGDGGAATLGDAFPAGNGGDFIVQAGVGGAGAATVGANAGTGGKLEFNGGLGGAGSANVPGADGGHIFLTSGAGGAGGGLGSGSGAEIVVTTGNGAAADTSTSAAGVGGDFDVNCGVGGNGSATGAGSQGGNINLNSGLGGSDGGHGAGPGGAIQLTAAGGGAAGPAALAGGAGGQIVITPGGGGAGSANGLGGPGGALSLYTGSGGAGGGAGGGGGGTFELQTGNGGNADTSIAAAGQGGALNLYCGAGGNGSSTGQGGNGGDFVILAGNGGNDFGAGAGAAGTITITGGPGGGGATHSAGVQGGQIGITAGVGGGGSVSMPPGPGGELDLYGGDAGIAVVGGANGGNVRLDAGLGAGTGVAGVVFIGVSNASEINIGDTNIPLIDSAFDVKVPTASPLTTVASPVALETSLTYIVNNSGAPLVMQGTSFPHGTVDGQEWEIVNLPSGGPSSAVTIPSNTSDATSPIVLAGGASLVMGAYGILGLRWSAANGVWIQRYANASAS